nr:pyrin isoform X2 [Dasypus novemcinctus]
MAKTLGDHLLHSLEELVPYDLEKFKFKLQNTSREKEQTRIPRGLLQMAGPVEMASLLLNHYGEEDALRLTLQILRAINQRLLAEELHRATGQKCPLQEGTTESSAMSCSSGENKPKSLKTSEGPESYGQRESGDGAASPLTSQPEVERGAQKKCPGKRRDEKGSEGLDMQSKHGTRGMGQSPKRSPFLSPGRVPWEKGKESPRLRRNASSASRLHDLSSRSFSGSLGRKDFKTSETSRKRRPKSLEFPIYPGEKGPPNSEVLLSQEGTRTADPNSTATPSKVATLEVEITVLPEQGSRNPENSATPEGGAFRKTLSNTSLTGEKTRKHPESTAPLEENGIGSPEAPVTLGEMVDSTLHETSNPQVVLSSEKKGPQNPDELASLGKAACEGRPPDKAVCSLCQAQEGDGVGGTCVHGSCCCSVASGDAGGHSPSCPQGQAPLPEKCPKEPEQPKSPQLHSLSPEPPPQCDRHMKQLRLLFCEDHREPVCLICSLSQEHRGHQVRPIEEAALECKKQIDTQRQKVQGQLEELGRFLEQQEQRFMAWLQKLGQAVGQVQGAYDSRVSRDVAVLDELIVGLEAKQCQPAWTLIQDIGDTLHRAKTVTVPEPWATPPEVKEKIHLLFRKSEFVEKSMKHFSESLRLEIESFHVPELPGAQAHAVNVILDVETAHPNLIISKDLKSVKLGNKWDRLPDGPERFDSCIMALGSPAFLSGCQYWEVEVGDKTAWILGVCEASICKKGSMALTPENGYWVVMMTRRNDYHASTFPPTHLRMREPPKRVGIFLNCEAGDISFYNVTAKSHIYTFTCSSSSGPLQPIFSPGAHDGGKNSDPLIICPVGGQGPC